MKLTDTSKMDYNTKIKYDFPEATLLFNQFQNTLSNNKFIQIPYPNSKPNLQIAATTTTSYTANALYIYKNFHEIVNVKYDGELIIEATSASNSGTKTYMCFLLKTDSSVPDDNQIDIVIRQSIKPNLPQGSFELNQYMNNPTNPCILYIDTNNNVVLIFTTPIPVKSDFTDFSNKPTIISTTSLSGSYNIIKALPIKIVVETKTTEGFQEGFEDIYIDCQPTGETAETIATYNLPIHSDLMGDINQTNFMRTTMNFAVFFMLCVAAYMVVPFWYKTFIMDVIHSAGTGDEVARLKAVDILLVVCIFIFSLSLSIDGIKTKSIDETTVGVMSFVLLIMSLVIMINKKSSDDNYSFPDASMSQSQPDFASFIWDTFTYVKENSTEVFVIWLMISIAVWAPTLYIYYYKPGLMPDADHTIKLIAGMWASYGSIFSVYFTKMISLKLAHYD